MSFFGLNQAALSSQIAAAVSATVGSVTPIVTSTLSAGTSGTYTCNALTKRVVLILQGAGSDGTNGIDGALGDSGFGGGAGQYISTTILTPTPSAFPYSIAQRAASPANTFFGNFYALGGNSVSYASGLQSCFSVAGTFISGVDSGISKAGLPGGLAGQTTFVSPAQGSAGGASNGGVGGSGGGSSLLGTGGNGGSGAAYNVSASNGTNATGFGAGGGGGGARNYTGGAGSPGLGGQGTGGVAFIYEYQS